MRVHNFLSERIKQTNLSYMTSNVLSTRGRIFFHRKIASLVISSTPAYSQNKPASHLLSPPALPSHANTRLHRLSFDYATFVFFPCPTCLKSHTRQKFKKEKNHHHDYSKKKNIKTVVCLSKHPIS